MESWIENDDNLNESSNNPKNYQIFYPNRPPDSVSPFIPNCDVDFNGKFIIPFAALNIKFRKMPPEVKTGFWKNKMISQMIRQRKILEKRLQQELNYENTEELEEKSNQNKCCAFCAVPVEHSHWRCRWFELWLKQGYISRKGDCGPMPETEDEVISKLEVTSEVWQSRTESERSQCETETERKTKLNIVEKTEDISEAIAVDAQSVSYTANTDAEPEPPSRPVVISKNGPVPFSSLGIVWKPKPESITSSKWRNSMIKNVLLKRKELMTYLLRYSLISRKPEEYKKRCPYCDELGHGRSDCSVFETWLKQGYLKTPGDCGRMETACMSDSVSESKESEKEKKEEPVSNQESAAAVPDVNSKSTYAKKWPRTDTTYRPHGIPMSFYYNEEQASQNQLSTLLSPYIESTVSQSDLQSSFSNQHATSEDRSRYSFGVGSWYKGPQITNQMPMYSGIESMQTYVQTPDRTEDLREQVFAQASLDFGTQSETMWEINILSSENTPSQVDEAPTIGVSSASGNCGENKITESREDTLSSETFRTGQKRLSAFQRLGPRTEPKKPKLTINLKLDKEEEIREVVDHTYEKKPYVPFHLRDYVINSENKIVNKYLPIWVWKRKLEIKSLFSKPSPKTAQIMEQMLAGDYKESSYFLVTIKGYPPSWSKEDVLDALLETLQDKCFIPCFTEFTEEECKFLVCKSSSALMSFYKMMFVINMDAVQLKLSIGTTYLKTSSINFIPRLILREILRYGYDGERKLCLKHFTLEQDLSHFIYFPLKRIANQSQLLHLQSDVAWDYLTDLDLSHNRIKSIDGFALHLSTPRLKHLDLSYNCIERVTVLMECRKLSLRTLRLEGNPLCHDYTDPARYVAVLKMMFTSLTHIDGIPIHLKGEIPSYKRYYCPDIAAPVVDRFLEVFFPLLDGPPDDRSIMQELYTKNAVLTVTCRRSLCRGQSSVYRYYRNLLQRCRSFDEGNLEEIVGASDIVRHMCKWPALNHDAATFTIDLLCHTDTTTILNITGLLKILSVSLADEEPLLTFSRTLVLHTLDGGEYKIHNEMLYWDVPTTEYAHGAFRINKVMSTVKPSLKLESPPDDDLKEKLVTIFIRLTELDKKASERCLEKMEWNLKSALDYFVRLLKMDNLQALYED